MVDSECESFDQQLTILTTRFVKQIGECVKQVPHLLTQYTAKNPCQGTVNRICELEASCDRTNREISALISTTSVKELGIQLTQINLHSGQLIELYQLLDEIANAIEQFAEELWAIRPSPVDDCLEKLHEMAMYAVDAMSHLEEVVVNYISAMCQPNRRLSVTETVDSIRALESESDRVQNEVTAIAFQSASSLTPLVYRELAVLLDTAIDTMEDATDQMLLITGNQEWVDIEPNIDS